MNYDQTLAIQYMNRNGSKEPSSQALCAEK